MWDLTSTARSHIYAHTLLPPATHHTGNMCASLNHQRTPNREFFNEAELHTTLILAFFLTAMLQSK